MSDLEQSIQELRAQVESLEHSTNASTETLNNNETWWSATEAMTISASVLLLGAFIMVVVGCLIAKGRHPEQLLRTFGTILIIISAVFLVVAGYSDKQIAPVMGLLGTIAGYLLGKSSAPTQSSGSSPTDR